jgi:hypothetical protein
LGGEGAKERETMINTDLMRRLKQRLVLTLTFGSLVVAFPLTVRAGSAEYFKGLGCVVIKAQVIVAEGAERPRIGEDAIRDAVFVAVRAKIPRLKVEESCPNTLNVYVMIQQPRTADSVVKGYALTVNLQLFRPAVLSGVGVPVNAQVWGMMGTKTGPWEDVASETISLSEGTVAKFAADYYKAGNP